MCKGRWLGAAETEGLYRRGQTIPHRFAEPPLHKGAYISSRSTAAASSALTPSARQ